MALDSGAVDMFSQQVAWILKPWVFMQGELSCSEFLLHPQLTNGEVPDFAQACSAAYPNGRGRVCPNVQLHRQSQVSG